MAIERWTPERRRQRTREALLDAAATVFARRGFHGASLDEIAETAGYTRGAIYKHFADKEELLHEVCVRLNERVIAEFAEVPSVEGPFDEVDIDAVAEHWRTMLARDPEFDIVMLEFQLHAMRNPHVRARALEFSRANLRLLADYIEQHSAEIGEPLSLPAEDLAAIYGITSDGFRHAAMIDPDTARLYGVMLDLIVRGLQTYRDEADQG